MSIIIRNVLFERHCCEGFFIMWCGPGSQPDCVMQAGNRRHKEIIIQTKNPSVLLRSLFCGVGRTRTFWFYFTLFYSSVLWNSYLYCISYNDKASKRNCD